MIGTIIMQKGIVLGEHNDNYLVIPVLYNNEGKLIETPQRIKDLRREFKEFEEAIAYSKSLKTLGD